MKRCTLVVPDAGPFNSLWVADDLGLLLYEERDVRILDRPPHVHLLSTVGLLHGLERSALIASAERIVERMTHPVAAGRRLTDRRVLTDLPDGTDEPARIGSVWSP